MSFENKLSLPLDKINFSVIDVETTGLSPKFNNIIEIGIVRVKNLKVADKFHTLINPGRDIPSFITAFTGITNDDVYDAPFFDAVADKITEFVGEDVITAHNLSFDNSFLKHEFNAIGRSELKNPKICTLKIARRIFPLLNSKSLSAVSTFLKIKNNSSHRALGDAETTARVLIKMINLLKKNYGFKTFSDLLNYQFTTRSKVLGSDLKTKILGDLDTIPDSPGVYYFLNSKNKIIYIGKAKSLRDRIRSYFTSNAPYKAKKILKSASKLKIELTNSELTALLREAETIKSRNPRLNTQLKKYGRKYFLKVSTNQEFPKIEISNQFDFDGNDYFGLFASRRSANVMLEMINKTFLIRECSDKEFNKNKKCFLADIDRCVAPCENKNSTNYFNELKKVYEFIYGKNQFALSRMINKMKDYSSKQKFEQAQEVKEIINLILSQTHKTSLLAEPVNKANVLFEINDTITRDYVLLLAGKIYIKKTNLEEHDDFEKALDDFFSITIHVDYMVNDDDLEKMKITLNWLIKNRNKIRCFYLKEFKSKEELYRNLTSRLHDYSLPTTTTFTLKSLATD